jgi:hypothetical protein
LLCIAISTLGKGFDEVCHTTTTHFLVKTIENVEEKFHFLSEEKFHFLSFFGEK